MLLNLINYRKCILIGCLFETTTEWTQYSPWSVMKLLSVLIVIFSLGYSFIDASLFAAFPEKASAETERKALFNAIINNDSDTMCRFSSTDFLKPFDDGDDPSGLRRYPILLAIQYGHHNIADEIISIIKGIGNEHNSQEFVWVDALGWSMADYAVIYDKAYIRKYLSAMIDIAGPASFSYSYTIDRFVHLAFRDASSAAEIILEAANTVHDPQVKQLLYRRTIDTFLERADISHNNILDSLECFSLAIRAVMPALVEEFLTGIIVLDRSTLLRFHLRLIPDLDIQKLFDLAVANKSITCLLVLIQKHVHVPEGSKRGHGATCTNVFDCLVKAVHMRALSLTPSRRDLNSVNLMYFAVFGSVVLVRSFANNEICSLPNGLVLTVEMASFLFSRTLSQDELKALPCVSLPTSPFFSYLFDFIFGDIDGLPVSEALKANVLKRLLPILKAHSCQNPNFHLSKLFETAVKYSSVSADLLMILASFFPNEECEMLVIGAIGHKLPLLTLLDFIRQLDVRMYHRPWLSQPTYTKLLLKINQDTVDLNPQHRELLYDLLKNSMSPWPKIEFSLQCAMHDFVLIFSVEEMNALQVLLHNHPSMRP